MTIEDHADELIEAGVFDDSNAGHAAALAAVDLLQGWSSYDEDYTAQHEREYRPHDVEEVIALLRAWVKTL